MRLLAGSLMILLVGCSYSIQKNSVPLATNYSRAELTYASVYTKVLRPSCIGCHGNGGGVNLESYASLREHLPKIMQSTVMERKMPKAPSPPLSSEQLGLLNAWLLAGAPETAPGMTEPEPLPGLEPTFASIKAHIFEPKCLSCHAPGKPVARIPLVTLKDLLDSPLELVIPGNADESGLILAVTNENSNKLMPPSKDASGQPTGFAPLKPEEVQVLRDWINRGARD